MQLIQQQRQKIRESAEVLKIQSPNQAIASKVPQKTQFENRPSVEAGDDDEEEDLFYEDDEEIDDEKPEIKTTLKPKEENKPVILTSNFFLPGKPIPNLRQNDFESQEPNDLSSDIGETSDRDKDNAEDVIDPLPEEETERIIVEKTTKKVIELPKPSPPRIQQNIKPVTEEPIEYEYVDEYEYFDEPTTEAKPTISRPTENTKYIPAIDDEEITTIFESNEPQQSTYETFEQETTVKPEIKAVKTVTSTERIETSVEPVETSSPSTTEMAENAVDSTEGYVVVASVQTSRSISGARYLTYPQVEQEEKRQTLSEAIKDAKRHKDEDYHNESVSDDTQKDDDLVKHEKEKTISAKEVESTEEPSVESQDQLKNDSDATSSSSEVPKTRVHKLSSISEKLAHLHELNEPKAELTTKAVPVVIRKFSPRTTTKTPRKLTTAPKKPIFDIDPELASLLPPGYKVRASSLSESTTASTTTPTTTPKTEETDTSDEKESSIAIDKKIQFKEISFGSLESLLPKGYKPPSENKPKTENSTTSSNVASDILSKIKFDENIAALLPKDYKPSTTQATTKAPFHLSTVTEDISKFLPPGFKSPKESNSVTTTTTKRPLPKTTMDDIGKFLPPGYRLPKSTTTTEMPEAANDSGSSSFESVLNKVSFKNDISALLPPGFKANAASDDSASQEKSESNEKSSPSNGTGSNANFKLIFPKGIGKRPGVRLTTPKPSHFESHGGPTPPGITIRKGLPTR